jgi:hypothetical protein
MIDLDAIKNRLAAVHAAGASGITVRLADHGIRVLVQMQSWEGNTAHEAHGAVTHLLGHAPADLTALVAEVERLHAEVAAERAAVVAWIRGHGMAHYAKISLDYAATMIERGEHRREGGE